MAAVAAVAAVAALVLAAAMALAVVAAAAAGASREPTPSQSAKDATRRRGQSTKASYLCVRAKANRVVHGLKSLAPGAFFDGILSGMSDGFIT